MQVRRKEREEGRTDRGTGPIRRPSIAIRKSGIRSRNIEKRVDTERYRENEHAWRGGLKGAKRGGRVSYVRLLVAGAKKIAKGKGNVFVRRR